MDWVHRGAPWTRSTGVLHGQGPQGCSMDRVHTGAPWTRSTGVVHGPGQQGWSMDPGPCFCLCLLSQGGQKWPAGSVQNSLNCIGQIPLISKVGR